MGKYIVRRLILTIPVLLGVVTIIYAIIALTPGDPARMILGIQATQEKVDALNQELGTDQPFAVRYINYMKGLLRLDFGLSYRTRKPVADEIFDRFPSTFRMAALSMVLSGTIGISLGVLSAIRQYTFLDTFTTVSALALSAIPGFWLGMMLMLVFSIRMGWLPTSGISSWKSFILPIVTLAAGGSAELLRLTRSTMLETVRQDYIRTARAKGASERVVVWNHAFRNALLPVITAMGTSFGTLLGGTVIVEVLFGIPGLGNYMVSAITQKDAPAVLASALLLASLFCLIVLAVDLLYACIDPRVKAKYLK